jgi:secreted trypsin-like serine protease
VSKAIVKRPLLFAALLAMGLALASTLQPLPASADRTAIIGGRLATEPYPFMASLRLTSLPEHHCGGALIAPEWIVTAAHCRGLLKRGKTRVRVGSPDREEGGALVSVKRVVVHPSWGRSNRGSESDIALVRLDRPVNTTPIPIATHPGKVGEPTRIIGWGMVCDDWENPVCADGSRQLRELDTVRVPDRRCAYIERGSELCTADHDGRAANACNGDSGGPQIRKVAGRWELIGATSRDGDDVEDRSDDSAGCATGPDGDPGLGIWTDVTHHRSWINDVIAAAAQR